MPRFCKFCCGLPAPTLLVAYILAWRRLDFCGGSGYGVFSRVLSILALGLSLIVSEYLLRCFGAERENLSAGISSGAACWLFCF